MEMNQPRAENLLPNKDNNNNESIDKNAISNPRNPSISTKSVTAVSMIRTYFLNSRTGFLLPVRISPRRNS